jgi:hypothetical protein
MSNYLVVLEGGWYVKNARSPEDAMNIAVAEAGKRLNPELDYVEISVGKTTCPYCGREIDSVFTVANVALVGLEFQMKVFNANNELHAGKIAKVNIGKKLGDTPLRVVEVEELE